MLNRIDPLNDSDVPVEDLLFVILNPAMKRLTQRRKGAKVRRFATVLTAVIIHPAGDKYFTGLLFVSPILLRLCAFA